MNTTTTKIAGEAMQITNEQIDAIAEQTFAKHAGRVFGTQWCRDFARDLLASRPAENSDELKVCLGCNSNWPLHDLDCPVAVEALSAPTAPAQSCGDAEQADAPQATFTRPEAEDPMRFGDRSIDASVKRLTEAYCVQQPLPVPDQMALVWRFDIGLLRNDWLRLRTLTDSRASEQADEAVTDAASDLAFSVFSGIDALRWLLNITTEFDRKDVRTRQAARLLDDYTDSFGKTNRQRLEDLWKKLNDKLPDDGRINEYLRAHDSASRELKARAKDSK
jgi:hypothetical protein